METVCTAYVFHAYARMSGGPLTIRSESGVEERGLAPTLQLAGRGPNISRNQMPTCFRPYSFSTTINTRSKASLGSISARSKSSSSSSIRSTLYLGRTDKPSGSSASNDIVWNSQCPNGGQSISRSTSLRRCLKNARFPYSRTELLLKRTFSSTRSPFFDNTALLTASLLDLFAQFRSHRRCCVTHG
jgi:hypothetical protein